MGKYKMNVAPYGFSDSVPFESLRSKIDDEILNNKKTDETQSEEIEEQSEKDAQHDEAIANLESSVGEVSEKAEQAQESAEQAAEAAAQAGEDAAAAKGVADEAKAMAEENAAAIEVLNGDGEGSVNKTVSDAINEVVSGAPEAFDTLKEIGEYLEEHGSEVADMMSAITKNTDDIQTNADAIAENASAISANADAIAENVQAIEDVSAAVAEEATAREDADNAIKTEVDEKIAPLAVKAEVTEEINAAVAPLLDVDVALPVTADHDCVFGFGIGINVRMNADQNSCDCHYCENLYNPLFHCCFLSRTFAINLVDFFTLLQSIPPVLFSPF